MRDFTNVKRVVIKIGTDTLSSDGGINTAFFTGLAADVKRLRDEGREAVIVTSGAIGMGAGALGIKERVTGIKMRQACAAVGMPLLMEEYRRAFQEHGIAVAQVLLTADVLNRRTSYLNLRSAFETLFLLGAVPVVNENDSVATDEIGTAFGDNDRLSAFVASKIDAGLLIMLSDFDGLYDKNPREHKDARPVPVVYEITKEIEAMAGDRGSEHSTGGMKTKIEAAKIAARAGCRLVIAKGGLPNVIPDILAGKTVGTVFLPKQRLSQRARWISNSLPRGVIRVDEGALKALAGRKSLLPKGVTAVEGEFDAGDVVSINDRAKAVTEFGSAELRLIAGKHSTEIESILGTGKKDVVAVPENIVFSE
ncbi:MAG: glutamate 5-kinase [Spirochaetales bacterium]|nr:glutamate 5-kinase [Spirochaetales bacterium]